MEDHDLLQLAAKAAGIKLEYCPLSGFHWVESKYSGLWWDPINVDGDAFRLAVKLDIAFGRHANTHWARWECNSKVFSENAEKEAVQDPLRAARRAIVRAAAEIGKSIP